MSTIPYQQQPLSSPDAPWDAQAEVAQATATDLGLMCAWQNTSAPTLKSSYLLPHHHAGTGHTNLKGVVAAGNALMGARGGVTIPAQDVDAVKTHLQKHYHEFGKMAPWESKAEWRWYQTKSVGGTLKDVNTTGRTVCGYFASFNTADSDGDLFAPGCFAKSIRENKQRIMHLLHHNTMQPIGRPQVLKEDAQGLYFETPVAPTQLGNDVLQLYVNGVYKEHSVGFELINAANGTATNDMPVNVIKEAKLWEGSTVTWSANPHTPFTGIKSNALSHNILDEALERSTLIYKQLHRGTLHDDTYIMLEIELKQLQALLAATPADFAKPDTAAENEWLGLLKQINKVLK